jgi:acetyltransferase
MTELDEIAWKIVAVKSKCTKPIYANFLGGELVSRAVEICRENGVPTFAYPERAVRAFSFQASYEDTKLREIKELQKHQKHSVAHSVIKFSGKNMNYGALTSLLSMYGVPMANIKKVNSEMEVEQAFNEMNGPVVMKISSPDILHKTDVGGVILGVSSITEAKKAYGKILTNVKKNKPKARIEGIIMMEMAKEGLELIIGAKRDSVFGPVIMFGFGGILVELIADYGLAIGPFDREKIRRLISNTKVSKIITGYRTEKKYNQQKLEDIILNIGRLVTEHPEINSLEINPLVLAHDGIGAVGLDAKIDIRS